MDQSYGGDLLSVVQAAKELNKAPRTVLNWITAEKIAATKLGPGTAGYVITKAEVDRVLHEEQQTSAGVA